METYSCKICGKKHEIHRVIDYPLPQHIFKKIDKIEYDKRVKEVDGIYFIDRQLVIMPGAIEIHLKGEDERFFRWQVWVSVTNEEFQKTVKQLQTKSTESTSVPYFYGKLESHLHFYENSLGLPIKLKSNDFTIEFEEDNLLKQEQAHGITEERVAELMNKMLYHTSEQNDQKLEKTFSERFDEIIDFVNKTFTSKGKSFIINIEVNGFVSTQIFSGNLLETRGKNSDLGLHLPFDISFDDGKKELELFKQTTYAKDFDYIYIDEIPTYQLNVGQDVNYLKSLIDELMIDVYKADIEEVTFDTFEV
jgi:hypothetical protein